MLLVCCRPSAAVEITSDINSQVSASVAADHVAIGQQQATTYVVIYDAEEAIEPEGLLFVLDQP